MRLGIISDTHGNAENTHRAIVLLESLEVETVLHCGDIGTVEVVALLARCAWPTHFVLGNTDYDEQTLAAAIKSAGMIFHDQFADLRIEGVRIALLHSHDAKKFAQVTTSGEYDLVCYGHTHAKKIERRGRTLILNPGALHRANPHSLAIVDLLQPDATIIDL